MADQGERGAMVELVTLGTRAKSEEIGVRNEEIGSRNDNQEH
jgi:hypothetical protein